MHHIKPATLATLILCFSSIVFGQSAKKPKSSVRAPSITAEASTSRLPPSYLGFSFVEMYQELEKEQRSFIKSEFETTAEFKKRIEKITPKRVSFVSNQVEQNYDADRQRLKLQLDHSHEYLLGMEVSKELIRVFDRPLPEADEQADYAAYLRKLTSRGIYDDEFMVVTLFEGVQKVGTAVGKTGMGIKMGYTKWNHTKASVALRHSNLYVVNQKFEIPMTTATARLVLGKIGVAITGRLRFPFSWLQRLYDNASLSNPNERHYWNYYLFVEADTLVFFDRTTGLILGSVLLPIPGENTGEAFTVTPRPTEP